MNPSESSYLIRRKKESKLALGVIQSHALSSIKILPKSASVGKESVFPGDLAREKVLKENNSLFVTIITLSCFCALIEPVIVGFKPDGLLFYAQIILLAVSTGLFIIEHIMTFLKLDLQKNMDTFYDDHNVTALIYTVCYEIFDGEVIFDACCLSWGWLFIFEDPGVAALRCVRIFRHFWYVELIHEDKNKHVQKSTNQFYSPLKASKLIIEYAERLFKELLSPQASRGGIIILAMLFYTTYLFAVVFHRDKGNITTPSGKVCCHSVLSCFYTLLRLSLYDSYGLDYLEAVSTQTGILNAFYVVLLFLFLIFTSIFLLNGLIGIFGHAFLIDDDDEDDDVPQDNQEDTHQDPIQEDIIRNLMTYIDAPAGGFKSRAHERKSHAQRLQNATQLYKCIYIVFLCSVTVLTLSEPFLVAFSQNASDITQKVVLGVSAGLVPVGMLLYYYIFYQSDDEKIREWNDMTIDQKISNLITGNVIFESFLITWGWVCIETGVPGLGALRCLRVFRLLSYYELLVPQKVDKKRDKSVVEVILIILRKCAMYLRKLGNEVFTAASKGGTLIISIFFYLTYLYAVVFWVDKGYIVTPEGETCRALHSCFYTILRLAFYDGLGLDFLTAVAEEQVSYNITGANKNTTYTGSDGSQSSGGYSVLLVIYMIVSAMILLNGLIGIFSNTFQADDVSTDDEILRDVNKILRDIEKVKMKLKRRVPVKAAALTEGEADTTEEGPSDYVVAKAEVTTQDVNVKKE